MTPAAILLHPDDNVVVCSRDIAPGERLEVEGCWLVVDRAVALGHKLALTSLHPGDKVRKYGMPIGSMTAAAEPGAWVHLHNMQSDYLPAHQRDTKGDHA